MRQKFPKIFFGIFIIFFCYRSLGCGGTIIGQSIPQFSLPSFQDPLTGQTFPPVNSETLKGKKTLLVVWASWCGACSSLHPQLMEIAKRGEWRIMGLVANSKPEEAAAFLREKGSPYSALSPGPDSGRIKNLPLMGGIPLIYAISAKGIILARHLGAPIPPSILAMH